MDDDSDTFEPIDHDHTKQNLDNTSALHFDCVSFKCIQMDRHWGFGMAESNFRIGSSDQPIRRGFTPKPTDHISIQKQRPAWMDFSVAAVAAEFVVGYYSTFVYNPSDLIKFFGPHGRFARPGMPVLMPVMEGAELGLPLDPSARFVVTSYHVVVVDQMTLSLVVTGFVSSATGERRFTQTFTLVSTGRRVVVQSDILSFEEPSRTFVVPKRTNGSVHGSRPSPHTRYGS